MIKIIIAGSRTFNDYNRLKEVCDNIIGNQTDVEIVSGGARGADLLGEKYAKEKGFNIIRFNAQWDLYGKSAGYIRNSQMAKYGDILIAFWDMNSKGTGHMINLANEYKLGVNVIKI